MSLPVFLVALLLSHPSLQLWESLDLFLGLIVFHGLTLRPMLSPSSLFEINVSTFILCLVVV